MELRADAQRNRAAILAAAAAVFAEHGARATTEQVAREAGVAVGTVFRHFQTKDALLVAIMKGSLERLAGLAEGATLAEFFGAVVDEAAGTRTVVEALAPRGLEVGDALGGLKDTTARLLAAAKKSGDVRRDVRIDEVMALLTALAQAAQQASWTADLRRRTLRIVLAGMR